jgi:hypothetical protein
MEFADLSCHKITARGKKMEQPNCHLTFTIIYCIRGYRSRWEEKLKMDLRENGWDSVDWIHLAQERNQRRDFINTVMNLWFP